MRRPTRQVEEGRPTGGQKHEMGGFQFKKGWRRAAVGICVLVFLPPFESMSAQDGAGTIEPPDVFARVALARKELERIRVKMGKPANTQLEIGVNDVALREVFFQALTLFRKADRLCFEQTRKRAALPKTPEGKIRPGHVFEVASAALGRIDRVKAKIGITEPGLEPAREADRSGDGQMAQMASEVMKLLSESEA